jgi:hypothetical protein
MTERPDMPELLKWCWLLVLAWSSLLTASPAIRGQEPTRANPPAPPTHPTPQSLASPEPAVERTDGDWVQQLGAAEFKLRDQARLELERRGMAASEAIRQGTQSTDPEIRRRCEVILAEIDAADKRRRLDQLVAASNRATDDEVRRLAEELQLPGWDIFHRYAGSSMEARQLYRDIMRGEWVFIEQSVAQPQLAPALLNQRLEDLASGGPALTDNPAATINAFLFSSLVAGRITDSASTRLQLMVRDSAFGAATATQRGTPVRQLLSGWVTDVQGGMMNHFHALVVSRSYRLTDAGAERARRILQTDPRRRPAEANGVMLYRLAIQTLMEFGDQKDVALLQPLLGDSSVVMTTSIGGETEEGGDGQAGRRRGNDGGYAPSPRLALEVRVSDLALYASLVLERRDVRQFGFFHVPPGEPLHYFDSHAGFVSDEERQAALKVWHDRQPVER